MARSDKGMTRRLVALNDLSDYKVADEDPDIRGWDVLTADRKKIGEVHELIVEPSAMRVKYLDIELDKEFRGKDDRHVLIPIEKARLNEDEDDVLVDRISSEELAALPNFDHQDISPDYEDSVWRSFGAESARARSGTTSDDSQFFGNRRRGRERAPYFTQRTADRELSRPIITEPPPGRGAEPSAAESPPAQRGESEPPPSRR